MDMCSITRLCPVIIRIVDGCRAGVQGVWGGGGDVAGDPYAMSPGGGGGGDVAGGPYAVSRGGGGDVAGGPYAVSWGGGGDVA